MFNYVIYRFRHEMNSGSSAAVNITNNTDIIQVYLADGSYKSVRVDSQTTVKVFFFVLIYL